MSTLEIPMMNMTVDIANVEFRILKFDIIKFKVYIFPFKFKIGRHCHLKQYQFLTNSVGV